MCSKQAGVIVQSVKPSFKYVFSEADQPVEVKGAHLDKILNNPTFYLFGKKDDSFLKELKKIKGIGVSTAEDIVSAYPTKEELILAVKSLKNLPFDSDVDKILRKEYGDKK